MKWKQKLTVVLLLAGGVLAALDAAYVTRQAAEDERREPAPLAFTVR
ncbi:MAG: hypothetical protein IT165_00110 [Bryobacterales bacterium]|nr:hypothetical protein [Bryobacterales bacterium]